MNQQQPTAVTEDLQCQQWQQENNNTISILSTPWTSAISLLPFTFPVYGDHLVYLSIMQDRYHLSSISATISIILKYIMNRTSYELSIIFNRIRCKHCGIIFPKKLLRLELSYNELSFLLDMQRNYYIIDLGKVMRIICDYLQIGNRIRGMRDTEIAEILNEMERQIFQPENTLDIVTCCQDSGISNMAADNPIEETTRTI